MRGIMLYFVVFGPPIDISTYCEILTSTFLTPTVIWCPTICSVPTLSNRIQQNTAQNLQTSTYINKIRYIISHLVTCGSIHNPFIFILVACTYYWADSLMMQITKACHGGFPLERYHVLLLMMKKGNIFHLYRLVLQHQCKRLKI